MQRIIALANVYLAIPLSAVLWALFVVLIPIAAGYGQNHRLEAMYRGMQQERPLAEAETREEEDGPSEKERGTPFDPGREAEKFRSKKETSRDPAIALLLAILAGSGAAAASLRIQKRSGSHWRIVASVLASLAVSTGVGLVLALASFPFIIVTLLVLLSD
ncbi:hypothetical protein [Paludisphaera soli]|uniref:hypothetical protein n=1 Tax=Paludisphaera soli TaxID=2712865 RepID=UPI0013EC715F|nr:hypothetical protein [Paludisphaera soli]